MDLPYVDVVVCSRRSDPSRSRSKARREVSTIRLPFLITNPALVAITTSSRIPSSREQATDEPFGVTGAVRRSRVDQRAAGLAEHLEQRTGLLGGGVAAPGHGAKPEPGYPQPAAPDLPSFHGETLTA